MSVERLKPAHFVPEDTIDIPVSDIVRNIDQTDRPSTSSSSPQGILRTYPGPKKSTI